jgi:microcystin-dependent protein
MSCKSESEKQMEAKIAELSDAVEAINKSAKFLLEGHPILLIQHVDDIAQFDFNSGEGTGAWYGWAMCTGNQYTNPSTKKKISTPNFVDRFIVMATGNYEVGDVGGADEVTLTEAQMPSHNHTLTDPGHGHSLSDPGHDHAVTDPGHGHTSDPHAHNFEDTKTEANSGSPFAIPTSGTGAGVLLGDTNTTKQTDPATDTLQDNVTGLTVNNAFTGIGVQEAEAGITIESAGSGEAHENRPPYYAAIYVMKLW